MHSLDLTTSNADAVLAAVPHIVEFSGLRKLCLSRNQLADKLPEALEHLCQLTQLQLLDLSENAATGADMHRCITPLARLVGLTELRLHGNALGASGMLAAAQAASSLSALRYLSLQPPSVGEVASATLCTLQRASSCLRGLHELTCLELGPVQCCRGRLHALFPGVHVYAHQRT